MRLLDPGSLGRSWAWFSVRRRCPGTQLRSFHKQPLSTCHGPGIVLGTGDLMMTDHFCP